MSNMLNATCEGDKVTAGGFEVKEVTILSEGKGASSGFMIMDHEKFFYVTSNASDLKTTIEKLVSSLNKIGTILTAIGSGMTGPTTAPPPTLPADVAEITSLATELETLKGELK